ncbi:MAG: pitrilysin family protein, partial [Rikenellaceae bacterium]
MEYQILEYPNGIRAVLKRTKSPVVYSAITFGAGSGDELPGEEGIAHFIEHMFFKGTLRRKQYHINALLDNVGGELNAYTTKEETVIHSTVLKGDFAKAVDLIHDVAFNSIFDNKEIEKECAVILDEINSYKDSPSDQIFDDFEDLVFAGSSLGHPILGSKRSLATFNTDKLRVFIDRCYNSDKIVFSVIGNVTFDRFKSLMDKSFADLPSNPRAWSRPELSTYVPKTVEVSKKTYQCHVMIG